MVRRRTRRDHGRLRVLSFVIDLVLLAFLLFWPPRYESLEAAKRASRPLPTAGAEMSRQPRRDRSRRRLARALTAVCAASTIIILLSIIASPTIMSWHLGGWIQL